MDRGIGHGRLRLALLAVVAATATLAMPAGAQAVTFGADMGAASDNTATCSQLPFAGPQASCLVFSGIPGPTFYAPASGTVTAVRVKVGPTTGPMQIVVMTSLYQNKAGDPGHPYFACCFVQQYGPSFTPTANAVTTVPASLNMVEQPTPAADDFATNARGDFLALSVLASDVPIPMHVDGATLSSATYPAPTAATFGAPSPNPILMGATGPQGRYVMMSADLTPGGGGGTGGVPQGNPLRITGGSLLGTTASIPLTCVLTTACDGVLQLLNRQATGAGTAAKKKVKLYGRKKFSIPAGKTKRIKVRLNKAGKRKLGRRKTLKVVASAKMGSQTYSYSIKLKKK